ncbi:MAG: 5-methylcytosine-specific restriction endonuclease system specificity protein McrC [Clostridiaceae bacterium]|nr:5-methylcytosine-specific restriction endonuclease system specificity protein McrC [Clostridiaceae bacterium]
MKTKIPIENIYYMLCYAWNRLKEKDIVDVKELKGDKMLDLLARVLINGLRFLYKKGLDRAYVDTMEETRRVKGKVNFIETINNLSLHNAKVYCEFDELTHNVLHNQIIKTTLHNLIFTEGLSVQLKEEITLIYQYFNTIDKIPLNSKIFKKVKLHRNNYFYGFLINICELLYNQSFVSEEVGRYKFKDFLQDEKAMPYLFEEFVRNFYKREQHTYKVVRENITWDIQSCNIEDEKYLPIMQTDISLTSLNKKIIIDTKYYKNALVSNLGSEKLISQNLYQLFSYLKNIEAKGGLNKKAEGILLYPKLHKDIDLQYEMQGHNIKIKTVNLNENWDKIHARLLDIIS